MEKFETREQVEFLNEGTKIFGVLHRPLGNGNCPIVVFCHGLAGHKIGRHRMYVSLAECLSKVGIASFRFDFRGSGDSEGEFNEMSFDGEVKDAVMAVDFVSKQPRIDATQLGIFGRSFGGAIAVYTAYQRREHLKCLALWAPVYDGVQWEKQWEMAVTHQLDENQRHELMRINGQLPSEDFYKQLITMNLKPELEALNGIPLLLIHGEKDPLVNISHSEKYLAVRNNKQRETSFIRLPHSDHDFTHPDEKVYAIETTCQWFAKTLL